MAIANEEVIRFMNLGIKGVVQGDPDGFFSQEVAITGDASGGTITHLATLGPSAGGQPVDMLMRLNFVSMGTRHSAVIQNAHVAITLGLPFNAADNPLLTDVLTPSDNDDDLGIRTVMFRDFREGLWTLAQKDTRFYASFLCDNVNGAVMEFTLQGYYWYMGRLRRREMAAD